MAKRKECLHEEEERVRQEEKKICADIAAADVLLNEATSKLQKVLSEDCSVNKEQVKVSYLMIDAAKKQQNSANNQLAQVREKFAALAKRKDKLLNAAMKPVDVTSGSERNEKKRKSRTFTSQYQRRQRSD